MTKNGRNNLINILLRSLSILVLISYYIFVILEEHHISLVTQFESQQAVINSVSFWVILGVSAIGVILLIVSLFINNEKIKKIGHVAILISYIATLTRSCFFILWLKSYGISIYISDIIYLLVFVILVNIEMFIYKRNKVVEVKEVSI